VVHSARDGRARLDLGGHLLAGIGNVKGWVYDEEADSVAQLDDTTRSVIRGHELHMLTIAPETRLGEPRGHGVRSWAGEAALAVEFRDDLGAPMRLYLRARDTLPLGWELVNHTGQGVPEVLATFAQWERVDGVRLFRHAMFTQRLRTRCSSRRRCATRRDCVTGNEDLPLADLAVEARGPAGGDGQCRLSSSPR
jgi:hypothetical protein